MMFSPQSTKALDTNIFQLNDDVWDTSLFSQIERALSSTTCCD